jgi:hypothetical protein
VLSISSLQFIKNVILLSNASVHENGLLYMAALATELKTLFWFMVNNLMFGASNPYFAMGVIF